MTEILRRTVDTSIERTILTGLITSRRYLIEMRPILNLKYFKIDYAKIVAKWCFDFYDRTKQAPKAEIQRIFELEEDTLDKAEARIIKNFLRRLSSEYERNENFNAEYVATKTKEYFEKRAIEVLSKDLYRMVEADKYDRAQTLLDKRSTRVETHLTGPENFFSNESISLLGEYDSRNAILHYNGALGRLIGPLEREWLVAFLAPMKRGKSWQLIQAINESLWSGLNVLGISCEMNKITFNGRIGRNITGLGDKNGKINVPCFDCFNNQDNTCEKSERVCDRGLPEPKPEYKPRMKYKPCIVCRNGEESVDFIPTTWFTTIDTKKLTTGAARKKLNQFKVHTGGQLFTRTFPPFSTSISDIEKQIDFIENQHDFIPDVIAIDYADILIASGSSNLSERGQIDVIWKELKKLAATRGCLVFTASQGNRESLDLDNIRERNVSEDIRKLAHVDLMIPINQTADERVSQTLRLAVMAHRHRAFDSGRQVRIIYSYEIGQAVLDSEFEY